MLGTARRRRLAAPCRRIHPCPQCMLHCGTVHPCRPYLHTLCTCRPPCRPHTSRNGTRCPRRTYSWGHPCKGHICHPPCTGHLGIHCRCRLVWPWHQRGTRLLRMCAASGTSSHLLCRSTDPTSTHLVGSWRCRTFRSCVHQLCHCMSLCGTAAPHTACWHMFCTCTHWCCRGIPPRAPALPGTWSFCRLCTSLSSGRLRPQDGSLCHTTDGVCTRPPCCSRHRRGTCQLHTWAGSCKLPVSLWCLLLGTARWRTSAGVGTTPSPCQ